VEGEAGCAPLAANLDGVKSDISNRDIRDGDVRCAHRDRDADVVAGHASTVKRNPSGVAALSADRHMGDADVEHALERVVTVGDDDRLAALCGTHGLLQAVDIADVDGAARRRLPGVAATERRVGRQRGHR
jgi:hypothetical protein